MGKLYKQVEQINPDLLSVRTKLLSDLSILIPQDVLSDQRLSQLILVNSQALHYIPFAAINISGKQNQYVPLAGRFDLITPFHLGSFLDNNKNEETLSPSITIFADPVFGAIASQQDVVKFDTNEVKRSWMNGMAQLPATLQEARTIGRILSTWQVNQLVGKYATNAALMSPTSRSSTILHIASHGYFSEQTPDIVGIATSVVDENDKKAPGFLSLRNMLAEPFQSQLVVVSGCETGMGRELKGEGLVSLARGLIGQGAGGVISTLWQIPDRPTALFMRHFYQGLVEKDGDIPSALTHAQMALMKTGRYRSPRYWAAFTYTGGNRNASSIEMQH